MSNSKERSSQENEMSPELTQILNYFEEISKIPRKSGSEQQIRNYIENFADKKRFAHKVDAKGNLLIEIPGNNGSDKGIVLQGHLDMVCEGNPDPSLSGVKPIKDTNNEWIYAEGTTLGADNGIGIATMLTIANSKIDHGPLALLFTVEEETGMDGAYALNFPELSNYSYLINLDSETEGSSTIGSAGAQVGEITIPIRRKLLQNQNFYKISITNFKGGHSGLDIGKGRENAIIKLAGLLRTLDKTAGIHLYGIRGGSAVNSIAKSSESVFSLPSGSNTLLDSVIQNFLDQTVEKEAVITAEFLRNKNGYFIKDETKGELLNLLTEFPNGVILWDKEIPKLVNTSSNLGKILLTNKNMLINFSSRSFNDNQLLETNKKIIQLAKKGGFNVNLGELHSGWREKREAEIVQKSSKIYEDLFGKSLILEAVHAGLECGQIANKYPHLQMISIGPTIIGSHSTDEKLKINSVIQTYLFLHELLSKL